MAEAADSQDQLSRDSRHLYRLCCDAGFSEHQWRIRLRHIDGVNTIYNYKPEVFSSINIKALHSGSASDGVAMDFLGSDIDIMFVVSGTYVIEDDDIPPNESDTVFKMISTTHPAFVNLEWRHRGETADSSFIETTECCELDGTGRLVLNSEQLKKGQMKNYYVQNGPALTVHSVSFTDIDRVPSLHCRSWPSVSKEWIDRPREYNWPTPEQINEIVNNGCELVAVGAPNSASPQFDFRLSSSMAEKILVRSFNIYQIQCYFLLKVTLKFRIKPCFSIETLCSYHMKTIMLYVVETTNPVVWREDNLVHCFMICLQKLQSFLRVGNCPQYFIPQQNLFERKVKPHLKKVMALVNDIVADGWRSVLRCPPYNDMTHWYTLDPRFPLRTLPTLTSEMDSSINGRCDRSCISMLQFGNNELERANQHRMDSCDSSLQGCIGMLQRMRFYKENESKYFPCKDTVLVSCSRFKSTIGLSLLNRVTRRQNRDHVELLVFQYAKQCMESACESSIVSCRLKYALFLYVNKETERCVDLVKEYVTAHCDFLPCCGDRIREKGPMSNCLYRAIVGCIGLYSHHARDMYKRLIPTVLLSKWEVNVCPLIIQNVAETRQLVTDDDFYFCHMLMIDPLVFAYLLLVLSYTDLGRCPESRQYLELLRQCAENPNQCFIFYPDIARLLLEQCQRYASSGSQEDVSPSI